MALAEINLRVIHALLQSDWFVQNLEFEPSNPGKSTLTYFSFHPPPTFSRACENPEKNSWLARLVCVSVCVCICVCVYVCVRVFEPACVFVCSSVGVGYTHTHTRSLTHTHAQTHECVCESVCVRVYVCP